eukprot:TRINITY_DN3556_c0_g1_i1.p3 TRINITY_DN3556_c0_g1~~TRINITY_DN3556_c0_g1_i1.p3  ORF type:complete len:133 (+),score=13.84 TRINITY_DN3556_c0_g1_i1:170-568(+)
MNDPLSKVLTVEGQILAAQLLLNMLAQNFPVSHQPHSVWPRQLRQSPLVLHVSRQVKAPTEFPPPEEALLDGERVTIPGGGQVLPQVCVSEHHWHFCDGSDLGAVQLEQVLNSSQGHCGTERQLAAGSSKTH